MTDWLLAAAAASLFAALQYGAAIRREGAAVVPLALLRLVAIGLLVALLLDARLGRDRPPAPLVALDASLSWTRGDSTRWARALARAREMGADSVYLFGDSLRPAGETPAPRDVRSSMDAVVEQAAAQGRPAVIISDGESAVARDALAALPRGSRVEVIDASSGLDLAVAGIAAPRSIASGDSLRVTVALRGGARPTPATAVTVTMGATVLGVALVPPLEPHAASSVDVLATAPAGDGPRLLRAAVGIPGDGEPRNDTMTVAVDVSPAAAAVWISSAPDLDSRAALGALRGLGIPTRGYLRVAPGAWRIDGTLAPVSEAVVRTAARDAPLLVLHGDTAVFGPPRALAGDAPLALMPGPSVAPEAAAGALDEWYPSAAPPSPAAAALAGVAWDSLPPVSLGAAATLGPPRGARDWVAVEGRRARRGQPVPIVVGSETPRRIVVTRGTGLWRWQARGGAAAVAYEGLWGSLFDWLAEARRDRRAAVPEQPAVREGDAVRWRIAGDSATRVVVARRDAPSRVDTMLLAPAAGTIFATSAPLAAGIHEVSAAGGPSLLPVNASSELLPRAPTLRAGPVGSGPVASSAPALRDHGLAYAAVVLLLCAEWVLRRRRGMR